MPKCGGWRHMLMLRRMTYIALALLSRWSTRPMMIAMPLGARAFRSPSSSTAAAGSAPRQRRRHRHDNIGPTTLDRGGIRVRSSPSSTAPDRRRDGGSLRVAGGSDGGAGEGDVLAAAATTTTAARGGGESTSSIDRGREKRKLFIGLAKAVDRGQFQNSYSPGGLDGASFVARSGLPSKSKKLFCVLGIESSCDDTGAAVVRSDGTILGESLASQHAIHEQFGGVVPGLAKTAHEENINGVIESALRSAGMSMEEIDAVGVTVGPGLEICLRVGCNRGRELAARYNKPFVGVHHLEAHILMARMPPGGRGDGDGDGGRSATRREISDSSSDDRAMDFPFLALLVSGGHCQILKCLGIGRYAMIGGTLDDSLGEAFDKTARLLGLPVGGGGGPAVEALALDGDPLSVALPVPMSRRKDCDFSYAGLKTSVRMAAERMCVERGVDGGPAMLPIADRADIAASFQHVAFRHVEVRLGRAMEMAEREDGIRALAVVGGVAANAELRRRLDALCSDRAWAMHVPPPRLCTDQGAMSAWAAVERLCVGSSDLAEEQEVFARYPFSVSSEGSS